MVTNVLGMLAGGYTVARILEAYPELTQEDVQAAWTAPGSACDRAARKHRRL
jgi:uncharacterized protein (DUF433 family)